MGKEIVILIAHYNDLQGLVKTVSAIDEPVHPDIVIVDDGSEHRPSAADLAVYEGHIHFLYTEQNKGIEHALNTGLEYILKQNKYAYIARLDCNDISHKNRFSIQTAYLDQHPEVQLLGSHVDFVTEQGDYLYTYKVPTEHADIKRKMYIRNCFIHPAVVYRSKLIAKVGHYPTNFKYAEDYAYFFEILNAHKTANLDLTLTSCRTNSKGISEGNRKQQLKSKIAVLLAYAKPNLYFVTGLLRAYAQLFIPDTMNKKLKTLYYK